MKCNVDWRNSFTPPSIKIQCFATPPHSCKGITFHELSSNYIYNIGHWTCNNFKNSYEEFVHPVYTNCVWSKPGLYKKKRIIYQLQPNTIYYEARAHQIRRLLMSDTRRCVIPTRHRHIRFYYMIFLNLLLISKCHVHVVSNICLCFIAG